MSRDTHKSALTPSQPAPVESANPEGVSSTDNSQNLDPLTDSSRLRWKYKQMREKIADAIDRNLLGAIEEIDNPAERVRAYMSLLPYLWPKYGFIEPVENRPQQETLVKKPLMVHVVGATSDGLLEKRLKWIESKRPKTKIIEIKKDNKNEVNQ
jgi:hypothetical protein